MLASVGLIFVVGLAAASIARKLKLPRLVGMLLAGIVMGPYVLDLLDPELLNISSQLRKMALVIILIKAGLSLNLEDLKKVGRPAILLSFVPATFEVMAYTLLAPLIFQISWQEAALMGTVLSAVSPAVVVPRMVRLLDTGTGTEKKIPQMILAGASLDDVYTIVLFSTFLAMTLQGELSLGGLLNIPVSIALGILAGILAGLLVRFAFHRLPAFCENIPMKVTLVLGVSFLLLGLETLLEKAVSLSGLLAVLSMAICIAAGMAEDHLNQMKEAAGNLWVGAELLLFVLVGAAVDIRYTLQAGAGALLMISAALLIRSLGVLLCLAGTPLNREERIFCIFAYMPKATVQAAIGGVPLSMGLACGNLILSVSVLAILITAPLGAFLIDTSENRLLQAGNSAC